MKKKIIIPAITLAVLVLIVLSAHIFVLANPRQVIFSIMEKFSDSESSEWFRNFESDFYELNSELLVSTPEKNDFRVDANAVIDVKNTKLGGEAEFEIENDIVKTDFFVNNEKFFLTPDFSPSPLIIGEGFKSFEKSDSEDFSEFLKICFECIESGECDSLFSATRSNITVAGEDFNKTVITLKFTEDDLKTLCGERFSESTKGFKINAKIDIALGFVFPVAIKADIEVFSKDGSKSSVLLEYTPENGIDAKIENSTDNVVNTFCYKQNVNNGEIFISTITNGDEKTSFSLPFEYINEGNLHKIRLSTFELNYDGVIIRPSFDILLEVSSFDYGFDIKLNGAFSMKKLELSFELNMSVEKAFGFDYTETENAISPNEEILKKLYNEFYSHHPKISKYFDKKPSEPF